MRPGFDSNRFHSLPDSSSHFLIEVLPRQARVEGDALHVARRVVGVAQTLYASYALGAEAVIGVEGALQGEAVAVSQAGQRTEGEVAQGAGEGSGHIADRIARSGVVDQPHLTDLSVLICSTVFHTAQYAKAIARGLRSWRIRSSQQDLITLNTIKNMPPPLPIHPQFSSITPRIFGRGSWSQYSWLTARIHERTLNKKWVTKPIEIPILYYKTY